MIHILILAQCARINISIHFLWRFGAFIEEQESHPMAAMLGPWSEISGDHGYEIGDVIDVEGRFGPVFKVKHKITKQHAVFKHVAADTAATKRKTRTAAQAMALCANKHVVSLYDWYETFNVGSFLFITEYCPGGTLGEFMAANGGPLAERIAQKFAKQIADALLYMHSVHVSHRTLTPDRILLSEPTENAVLKINGFFESAINRNCDKTEFKTVPPIDGSEYMAPELLAIREGDDKAVYGPNGIELICRSLSLSLCITLSPFTQRTYGPSALYFMRW